MNNERLMILLLLLDFDEYCETLLEYQLSREYMGKHPMGENHGADSAAGVGRGARSPTDAWERCWMIPPSRDPTTSSSVSTS